MTQILRTTLIQDEAQASVGSPTWDLPVNPLSIILFTVKMLNNTAAIANYSSIQALLDAISALTVNYRGANIISGSLADLAVLYGIIAEWPPTQSNRRELDNDVRSITVPICLGRFPYDPEECFPATRRGDLILQATTVIAPTGLDTMVLQAETVELLDAQPKRFVKATTTTKIFNATGEHDIEVPIGNDLLGALLWGPVVPTGASYNASFGQVALQVDNVETVYSKSNWETMHGELNRRLARSPQWPHTHGFQYDPTGVAVTQATTREAQENLNLVDNYAYLDLDPLRDGKFALKTKDAARVNMHITTEAASATAMRVLPVELVELGGAGA